MIELVKQETIPPTFVARVIYPVPEREVKAVVLPASGPDIPEVPRPGEVLPVLVEGHRHDPVRGVEGLLYSVPVVDVYVYVEYPLVVLQQLKDGQHYVVNVAET